MAIEYERVNWDTTKYVNPTNMNQMDAGIKAACDGVDENSSAITAINSTLQTKTLHESEVFSDLGQIDSFTGARVGNNVYISINTKVINVVEDLVIATLKDAYKPSFLLRSLAYCYGIDAPIQMTTYHTDGNIKVYGNHNIANKRIYITLNYCVND